jgi:hypothetical protein
VAGYAEEKDWGDGSLIGWPLVIAVGGVSRDLSIPKTSLDFKTRSRRTKARNGRRKNALWGTLLAASRIRGTGCRI